MSIVIYVISQESRGIMVVLSATAFFTTLPLVVCALPRIGRLFAEAAGRVRTI